MSAMVYWSAASHSWFFRWSSSTCSQPALQAYLRKRCASDLEIRWGAEDLLGQMSNTSCPVLSCTLSIENTYSQQQSMFHTGATQMSSQWDERCTGLHSLHYQDYCL